jgi:hypothetical protein
LLADLSGELIKHDKPSGSEPVRQSHRRNFDRFIYLRPPLASPPIPWPAVPAALLGIQRLVVDEFQDLNACDQEFIHAIAHGGAILWVEPPQLICSSDGS